MSEARPVCACGHAYIHHFGDGPCLCLYVGKDGKPRAGSVCPCVKYEPAEGG